jgi:Spy/CpxP family protein refolding chaperone
LERREIEFGAFMGVARGAVDGKMIRAARCPADDLAGANIGKRRALYTSLQRRCAARCASSYSVDITSTLQRIRMFKQDTPFALRRALAATFATVALASGGAAFAAPPSGPGGWHGGFDADPAAQGRRIDSMLDRWLAGVDATAEQRERIAAIMKGAAGDLAANRASRMEARRQAMALLAAPTIDRARLETLRVEQMQLADASSRRMMQAMVDSAEVLTPAQRSKLAERRAQRRGPPPAKQ